MRMIDDDVFDVASTFSADAQIDRFIEKRSKEVEEANQAQLLEEELDRRERARTAKRLEENRRAKLANLGHLHRVYLGEVARVADERSRLLAEAGYDEDEDEPNEAPGPEATPPTAEGLLEGTANGGGGGYGH